MSRNTSNTNTNSLNTNKRNQKAKLASDYNKLLKELTSTKIKTIGCYTIGETIGEGSYGKVKLGVHQLTSRQVAIKRIHKKHAPLMAREIHHHRQLHHPNIVSLYEILSTETSIFLVSEHCPHGDLFDALTKSGRFPEVVVQRWFAQLVDAVDYCHSKGIIHRDLKLENVLLDEFDNVKICDFGFARQTDKHQLLKTFCGSLAYSAPEVIKRQNYFGPETDVWSLGVILYTLLAGELPFDDECESILQNRIVNIDYKIPSYFSSQVTDLLSKMLVQDPTQRMTTRQMKAHGWLLSFTAASTHKMEEKEENGFTRVDKQNTSSLLVMAGFDTEVVRQMSHNQDGMLGTLYTMLLENVQKRTKKDENPTLLTRAVHNVMTEQKITTTTHCINAQPDIVLYHHHPQKMNSNNIKSSITPLTPILKKTEDSPVSSTCSSAADEDEDDDDDSSPDTSVTDASNDEYSDDDEEEEVESYLQKSIIDYPINVPTIRVSPMPSRVDISRPRYNPTDNKQLRSRLESKMIVEEEEEE
ncbi:Pkinase-domain-containing protein [Backusella circina FSU 941]|nr:Pkinase-domain-containing protein [Backusella circina FSU 941]